jgi:hypothetical protein
VGVVEVASEGEAVGKSLDTQGTLVDVWKVCLRVEGSLKGVVRPIGTVGAGIAATGSQRLGLIHTLGRGDEWYGGKSGSFVRWMSAAFILVRGLRR